MNRQVILTVILLLLSGVAVYMYQGTIMDYASPVVKPAMRMVGLGGSPDPGSTNGGDAEMEGVSSGDTLPVPPADRLVTESYFNLIQSFQRTFSLPVHDTSAWSNVDGVSVSGQFRASVPESIAREMPWARVVMDYSLTSHSSGNGMGSLTIQQPGNLPVQALEFQKNSSAFQLVFPEKGEYFRGAATSEPGDDPPGQMVFDIDTGFPEVRDSEVTETTWEGRDVLSVEVTQEGTVPATLYTTTSSPYSVVGVKYESDTGDRAVVVSYRGDSREKFSRVEVRGDGSGIVDFQYGNDRLRTARFKPDSSGQYEWIQLSMSHGDEYSNGAVLSVSSGRDKGPTKLGTFDWSVEENQISSMTAQFNIPLNEDSASMTLAVDSVSWLQDPEPVVLSDTSGMTRLSRNELGQKFMPVMMMAVSGMNQTAGDTAPGAGEAEEEMVTSPQPAETETEETPSEQAARPSKPSDEEPEPEPSPEPSEPDGGVETPANSGETMRYSSIGRFPMSEPPPAYEEARDAYGNGDFTAAQKVLAPLVEKYPNSANANYLMGMIHFEQGNFEEARPFFEKAAELEHDPQIKVWSEKYLDRIDSNLNGSESRQGYNPKKLPPRRSPPDTKNNNRILPTSNLFAHYPLNEIDNNLISDNSVNDHHGIVHGATLSRQGISHSNALQFDGKNDYVELKMQDIASITSESHTYSFWFKISPDRISGDYYMPFGLGGNELVPDNQHRFLMSNSYFEYRTGKNSNNRNIVRWNVSMPDDGKWHHLAVVAEGGGPSPQQWKFYMDGQLVEDKKVRFASWQNPGNKFSHKPFLGAQNEQGHDSNFYKGEIDEFRIYSKALTSREVRTLKDKVN